MLCFQVAVFLSLLCPLVTPLQAAGFGNEILVHVYNSKAMKYQGGANKELIPRVQGRSQILKLLVAAGAPGSGSPLESKATRDSGLEHPGVPYSEEFEKMIRVLLLAHQAQSTPVSKRGNRRSKFALSIDVPTNILSILIELAKEKDMRAKAAANAELMARIGRRK